jgi:hypothetical protein
MTICKEDICKKFAAYNLEGETAKYCSKHKIKDMINFNSIRCEDEECKKLENFNYEDKTNPLYCSTHKLDDMINTRSKRCVDKNVENNHFLIINVK